MIVEDSKGEEDRRAEEKMIGEQRRGEDSKEDDWR